MIYGIVCLTLIRLRLKSPDKLAPFRIRYGYIVAVVGFCLTLWLLSGSPTEKKWDIIIAMAAGLVIYLVVWLARKNEQSKI